MKNPFSVNRVVLCGRLDGQTDRRTDRRKDRHVEANSRLSHFRERA